MDTSGTPGPIHEGTPGLAYPTATPLVRGDATTGHHRGRAGTPGPTSTGTSTGASTYLAATVPPSGPDAHRVLDVSRSVLLTHHRPVSPLSARQEIPAFAQAMGWFTLDQLEAAWVPGAYRDGTDLTHRKNHRKRVSGLRGIRAVPIDEYWGHGRLAYAWATGDRRREPTIATRHGLALRTIAVMLARGSALPPGATVHVLDGAEETLRLWTQPALGDCTLDGFGWPDLVVVPPHPAGDSRLRLPWDRSPMTGLLVDSGHSDVDLAERVARLAPWWPVLAVLTANRHLAASHQHFAGVPVVGVPAGWLMR